MPSSNDILEKKAPDQNLAEELKDLSQSELKNLNPNLILELKFLIGSRSFEFNSTRNRWGQVGFYLNQTVEEDFNHQRMVEFLKKIEG